METKTFKSGSPIFRKPKKYEEDLITDDITLIVSIEVVNLGPCVSFSISNVVFSIVDSFLNQPEKPTFQETK